MLGIFCDIVHFVILVCVNFTLSDRRKECLLHCLELYVVIALGKRHSVASVAIRSSVPAQTARICNSVRSLHCFAQYTFTSIFYLFNKHLVSICFVSLMLLFEC